MKQQWLTWLSWLSIALLAALASSVSWLFGDIGLEKVVAVLGAKGLFALIGFLIISWFVLLANVIHLSIKRSVFSRLKPVPGKGYSIDPKFGEPVCPHCSTPEKLSYLSTQGDSLYCFCCNTGVLK